MPLRFYRGELIMTIKFAPEEINVTAWCGIVDVYGEYITSFIMVDEDTLNVKHRISDVITSGHNISVV